jgi:maltooligosyltrehalose trehalohydrolase
VQQNCLRVETDKIGLTGSFFRQMPLREHMSSRGPGRLKSTPLIMRISVWAPYAQRVELDLPARRVAMEQQPNGWWSVTPDTDSPLEYAYILDGSDPVPDPRSAWQPFGVHGPSRTVDHAAFRWTDARWQAPPLSSAVVYELHVGTFTPEGTFDAVVERIPHLLELGVTHVELMPVGEFPGERGWGYDGVDLYAPHHTYGGPDGLKRLVNALHGAGLAAILDVVYNHLGPSGNYLSRFGPYFTSDLRTPWGDAVNLGGSGSAEVRAFFIENALMWLRDYHFDGLRLDAVHALVDSSATHFLEELGVRVEDLERELGRHLAVIAESDLNDPRIIRPRELGGYGLAAQWSDDLHHALHSLITGESGGYYADFGCMQHLAKALEHGFVYDGAFSQFRGRAHGRPLEGAPKSKLLGYLQTHDQVGNRGAGERISALASLDRVKAGAALVLTSPFIPMIFQGEEWAASTPFLYFTDHVDPDLVRAVSEGRRREFAAFGWMPEDVPDPQDRDTFVRSKLEWQERAQARHREMLNWYRDLIALRPRLHGEPRVTFSEPARWIRVDRGDVSVLCNFGPGAHSVTAKGRMLLGSRQDVRFDGASMTLPPDSAAILSAG